MKKTHLDDLFTRLKDLMPNREIKLHKSNGWFTLLDELNAHIFCFEYLPRKKMELLIIGLIRGISFAEERFKQENTQLYITSPRKELIENNKDIGVGNKQIEPEKLCNLKSIYVSSEDSFDEDDHLFILYQGKWYEVNNIDFE